jgi:hypothetical protein
VATSDLHQVLQVPGRLCINPTSLTSAFPHGGTALGTVHQVGVQIASGFFDVTAEEFGDQVVESIFTGEQWGLAAVLRQFDEDAIAAVFPNTTTGTTSKRVTVRHWSDASSPNRPGHKLSGRSVKLLFSPLDSDRNRAVIFYRALPRVAEQLELMHAVDRRVEVPVVFLAIPDATMRVARSDFLRDMAV